MGRNEIKPGAVRSLDTHNIFTKNVVYGLVFVADFTNISNGTLVGHID